MIPLGRRSPPWTTGLALVVVSAACGAGPVDPPGPVDLRVLFDLRPLGDTPFPADNPSVAARVQLGRLLFFDPILSGELDVSCGACHHPAFGFADGRDLSAGTSGVGLGPDRVLSVSAMTGDPVPPVPRNSPTVLNAGLNGNGSGIPDALGLQFWDGRALGLEDQAKHPLSVREEMRGDAYPAEVALDSVMARLRDIPEYVRLFRTAFPGEFSDSSASAAVDVGRYARAVAAYERELVTRNSAFDRWVEGDDAALSSTQLRGLELFFGPARCGSCHVGPLLSDFRFHAIGVPQVGPGKGVLPGDDTGREEHTRDTVDRHAFRTPGLRNVALTAPYMHDGVHETLEVVVRFYDEGGRPRHSAVNDATVEDELGAPLDLSDADVAALVGFLESLTDPGTLLDPQLLSVPTEVPSGLPPVVGVAGE